jgi:hypothetical protein
MILVPTASGHFKGISLAGLDLPWLWPEDKTEAKKNGRKSAATRKTKTAGSKRVETNSAPARETR